MAILALATSGPSPELGLRHADGRVRSIQIEAGRGRGRDVAPQIARLLREEGLAVAELRGIAVDIGPGSFTGVRVGVTMAKTLAYAAELPVHAVDSLTLLATDTQEPGPVVAVRDAGRNTVYLAAFDAPGAAGRAVRTPATRADAAALTAHLEGATAVGEALPALFSALGVSAPALEARAGAEALLACVTSGDPERFRREAHELAPLYLQASAPERLRAGER